MSSALFTEIDIEQAIAHLPLVVSPSTSVIDVLALMSQVRASCYIGQITTPEYSLSGQKPMVSSAVPLETMGFYPDPAYQVLAEARSSCVLIVNDDEQLLGIFTERDVIHLSAAGKSLAGLKISQVMSPSVITIRRSELADLLTPMALLRHHHIRHLPVISNQGQIIGLLTHESLQQLLRPIDLFRLRLVSEVMATSVVSAPPTASVLTLAQQMATHRVSSVVIVEERPAHLEEGTERLLVPLGIVTERDIVQFQALELDFDQVQAATVMSTPVISIKPDDSLWAARSLMQSYRVSRVVVTGARGELVGIVTQSTLLQVLSPIELYRQLEGLEQRVMRLEAEKLALLQQRTHELEAEVQDRVADLQEQAEREQLLRAIAGRVHASLDLQDTLNTIVTEVRQWLECDRALIYQFQTDCTGVVLAEAVASGWPSFLGHSITDPCFATHWLTAYQAGRIRVVNDINTDVMTSCHRQLLQNLQVRAKILLPVIVGDRLWGLILVAQSNAPRIWKTGEIEMVQHLSTQAAIAIQQAELYQQAQQELQERQRMELILRESEELHRTILSAISDAVFMTDHEGNLTFIGPNVPILFGYSVVEVAAMQTLDTLFGRRLFDTQQLPLEGELTNIECDIQDKQGRSHTVLVNVKQVQIGRGTVLYSCRDISDRKQVEKALKDSEERLRTIVETSASGLIAINRRGVVVFANPAAARMFGIPKEELQGWFLGLPCTCGRSEVEEIELHQPSGDRRIATMQTAKISWAGREACLISLSDITALKRAEESLRQSEMRYRLLVENLPVGLMVHSADTYVLACNAKACELLELNVESLWNHTPLELTWNFVREDETSMSVSDYPVNRVLTSGQPLQNYVLGVNRPQSKGRLWLLINAFPVMDGAGTLQQVVVTFVDISDRKQAEITLRQNERRYASLTEAAPVGIFRTNEQGHYLYVNDRWCQIAGLKPETTLGDGWKQGLHPEDQDAITTEWYLAALEQRPFRLEYRFRQPNGLVVWVYGQAVAEQGEDGRVVGYVGTITDITARKQMEEQLHQLNVKLEQRVEQRTVELAQANQLLTLVMDSIPQRIFWKDRQSVLLGCNRNFAQDVGLTPEEVVGKRSDELYPLSEVAQFSHEYDLQVMQTGEPRLHVQETIERSDGSLMWAAMNCIPLWDGDNNSIGTLGTYEDITNRRIAEIALRESEEALRYSEERFRIALRNSPIVVFNQDLELRYTWIYNPALGFDPEDVVGCFDTDLFRAEDAHTLQALKRQVLQTGQGLRQEVVVNMADDILCYVLTIAPLCDRNGILEGVTCAALDITERKKAELALQDSQYLIQRITEASPDILYIYDLQEHRNVYTNREITRLLGYLPGELQTAGTELFATLIHPEDLPKAADHYARFTAASDTDIFELEYRVCDRNGNWHWFISRDTIFSRDTDNHPKQIVGAASEITERKRIEAELRQTNAELARATRLKDEFLANMSHELRTPLNSILGMAEGLQEGAFEPLNSRQEHAVSTIERSGRHLLELINDILDLAKIEAGKLELHLAPVAVSYLCESSLAFIKQQALQKRIQLQIKIAANLGDITLDERRIRQVLINLLSNAVKFTPNGGQITLAVQLKPDEPPSLWFSVIDTGIGIAADDLSKLFQSFVQIDSSLNRQQTGTGLGLALVKRIVELHGGQVVVSSEINHGSCFTVCLPYVKTVDAIQPLPIAQESVQLPISSPSADRTSPRILLAEDNEANINTVSSYLESRGYQVIVANHGQEAVELAITHHPELILMDIQMPYVDGLEATRRIRANSDLQGIPIIALTALAMEGDRDRCLEAGATHYLTKPVRLKQLVMLIQQLLNPST